MGKIKTMVMGDKDMIRELLESLRLIERRKTNEEIKSDIEESNEQNYRDHKRKFVSEFQAWKNQHKELVEYHLNKPIDKVTEQEAIQLGFISDHLTRKHSEEIFNLRGFI
jgi:ABC-type phosphate transport system auxiliary subunit